MYFENMDVMEQSVDFDNIYRLPSTNQWWHYDEENDAWYGPYPSEDEAKEWSRITEEGQ